MSRKLQDSLENTANALQRFKEAVELSNPTDLERDGIIQRFEFTLEQMWNFLGRVLQENGEQFEFLPKPILQHAYRLGWINEEEIWLNMLKDRNQTSHTYKQNLAKEIYERLKTYYPLMQQTYDLLYKKHFPTS